MGKSLLDFLLDDDGNVAELYETYQMKIERMNMLSKRNMMTRTCHLRKDGDTYGKEH